MSVTSPVAIVRPPGDSFVRAISSREQRTEIDPERARAQHEQYRETLGALGVAVVTLPPNEAHPDSCFTQDLAVVLDRGALLARSAEPSRRGEEREIEPLIGERLDRLERTAAPATLEGGDVMRLGRRLIAGRSSRTNEEGITALRSFAGSLEFDLGEADVPVGILHLQTGATAISDGLVIGIRTVLDQPAFANLDRIVVDEEDLDACNVLAVGRDVVMATGFPPVRRRIGDRGYSVHEVDLSEFLKADGGPTCLSLLV